MKTISGEWFDGQSKVKYGLSLKYKITLTMYLNIILNCKVKYYFVVNPCRDHPCQLHGQCQIINVMNYKCNCIGGYTGFHCEHSGN